MESRAMIGVLPDVPPREGRDFRPSWARRAGFGCHIHERGRDLVPDRAVWPFLVVVSAPNLQLLGGIGKTEEPVRVQTLRPEPGIERFIWFK